jgi:hypothetical protein
MATATDGQRAHDILLSFAPLSKHGYCWYYVWQAYAAAGARTSQGSTPTAYAAWNATQGKHPGDRNPPPGAAVWLGRRYDGNMDGDVFIAGQFDGDHAATDQPTWGATGVTSIQARMNLTGREYLGWSDHVLDCPIITGGGSTPIPPATETNEEETAMFIAILNGGDWYLVIPQGSAKPRAVILDGKSQANASAANDGAVPRFTFTDDFSVNALRAAVDGL